MSTRVVPFTPVYEEQVVDLILSVQRNEFGIDITAEQQPDLREIPAYYQTGRGNFWVALASGKVVGTISLLDIGNRQAALRKMFVHLEHRGATTGTAKRLLEVLLTWAGSQGVREIFLGTTPRFHAAHRFYEKNGFSRIGKNELPEAFPIMKVDTRFHGIGVG